MKNKPHIFTTSLILSWLARFYSISVILIFVTKFFKPVPTSGSLTMDFDSAWTSLMSRIICYFGSWPLIYRDFLRVSEVSSRNDPRYSSGCDCTRSLVFSIWLLSSHFSVARIVHTAICNLQCSQKWNETRSNCKEYDWLKWNR